MKAMAKAPAPGSLVYVRYRDHVLFRDMDPALAKAFVREAVGWLDHDGPDAIRLVWERFAMPDPPHEAQQRATGLVILKEAILELRRIG